MLWLKYCLLRLHLLAHYNATMICLLIENQEFVFLVLSDEPSSPKDQHTNDEVVQDTERFHVTLPQDKLDR